MRYLCIATVLLLGSPSVAAQSEGETQPAPLVLASGDSNTAYFQFGAEAYGLQSGADYVGGVNASLLFRFTDFIWVGLRSSAHYVMLEDSPYDVTWFHPDFTFQMNFLHDPVRLYLLGAGGFSVALDTDSYFGIGHGWSATGGVGVAWRDKSNWGLFLELAFTIGRATDEQTMLVLDESGQPQCIDEECRRYITDEVTREYELTVFTFNFGVLYAL